MDIGGTKIAAGVVDGDGQVLTEALCDTPSDDVDRTVEAIAEVVAELRVSHPDVTAVGVGAAGFVDEAGATVLFAPNLAWRNEPLKARLTSRLDLPVLVDNDANTGAWAESRFGAGRGARNVVMVAVGTGIGGGIVLEGRLFRGSFGLAAEFGHQRVIPNGRRCGCGNRGCWEQYCSGKALEREARDLASGAPLAAARILELAGGSIADVRGRHVTQAAQEGDPGAIECLTEVGEWLGQGLADLAAHLDPDVFVIGGGVASAGELLTAPARAVYANNVTGRGHRHLADVRLAALGNRAGFVGAADLAATAGRQAA